MGSPTFVTANIGLGLPPPVRSFAQPGSLSAAPGVGRLGSTLPTLDVAGMNPLMPVRSFAHPEFSFLLVDARLDVAVAVLDSDHCGAPLLLHGSARPGFLLLAPHLASFDPLLPFRSLQQPGFLPFLMGPARLDMLPPVPGPTATGSSTFVRSVQRLDVQLPVFGSVRAGLSPPILDEAVLDAPSPARSFSCPDPPSSSPGLSNTESSVLLQRFSRHDSSISLCGRLHLDAALPTLDSLHPGSLTSPHTRRLDFPTLLFSKILTDFSLLALDPTSFDSTAPLQQLGRCESSPTVFAAGRPGVRMFVVDMATASSASVARTLNCMGLPSMPMSAARTDPSLAASDMAYLETAIPLRSLLRSLGRKSHQRRNIIGAYSSHQACIAN